MDTTSPTIYDVAARANVSVATVSRHINGSARLTPSTKSRVEKAISDLGFVPNSTAQRLSSGKHMIIGAAFPKDFIVGETPGIERESMLYIDTLLRSIETESSHRNYSVLLSFMPLEVNERAEALQRMAGSVDGIIALERVITPEILKAVDFRMPLVVLAAEADSTKYDSVTTANAHAMASIARHMIEGHGIKTAGFINGRLRSPDGYERRDSFLDTFRSLGGKVKAVDILDGDWSVDSGYDVMMKRLRLKSALPECFVSANDQMALGVQNALEEKGYSVPKDVFLTGFDDTPMSLFMNPPLTTVRQDTYGMGQEAVRLLVDAIANPGRPKQCVTLATELVVRNSCGCQSKEGLKLMRELAS